MMFLAEEGFYFSDREHATSTIMIGVGVVGVRASVGNSPLRQLDQARSQ